MNNDGEKPWIFLFFTKHCIRSLCRRNLHGPKRHTTYPSRLSSNFGSSHQWISSRRRWWIRSCGRAKRRSLWKQNVISGAFYGSLMHKNHERSMKKESWKSRRQDTTGYKFSGYTYSGSQSPGEVAGEGWPDAPKLLAKVDRERRSCWRGWMAAPQLLAKVEWERRSCWRRLTGSTQVAGEGCSRSAEDAGEVDQMRRSCWRGLTGSAEVAGEDWPGAPKLLAKVDRERRSCWRKLIGSAEVCVLGHDKTEKHVRATRCSVHTLLATAEFIGTSTLVRSLAAPGCSGQNMCLELCLESDRPGGQTVHPRAEQHRGFTLTPVSSVGEAVRGVSEAVRDEKITGSKEHSTKTWPMMQWLLRHTNKSPSPWPKRATTSGVRPCTARKSARVCVRRGVLCTPIVTFMEVATVWTLNCQKFWEVRKTTNGGRIQVNLTIIETLSLWLFRTSLLVPVEFEDSCVVVVIADPTILCLATLQSASHAIDGPKMKNSTTLRMKMTRNSSASWNLTTPSVGGLLDPMCHVVLFVTFFEMWGTPVPSARWRLTRAFADD